MSPVSYFWPEEVMGKRLGPEIEEEGDRTRPYSEQFWSVVETLSMDKIKEIQWKRLEFLLKFAYENSLFYRKKWDEAGVKPSDIKGLEDLPKLPIITKADCAKDREENPPFGTIATTSPDMQLKFYQTSGTTGKPQIWTITRQEWENCMEISIRGVYANGVRKGWRGFYFFSFVPFPAFWGLWGSCEFLGCQNVPKGVLPMAPWLELMKSLAGLSPSFLAATPTGAIRQMEAARQMGIDPKGLKINLVIVSGEPGYGIPATNRLIREGWNAGIVDMPGSTEAFGPFMYSCPHLSSQEEPSDHLVSDYWIFEILDPKTLQPVEADSSGVRTGVSCVTALTKYGMPAIRFLLNDYLAVQEGIKCQCGRTLPIVLGGIKSRADDMMIIKGVNIYPAVIEECVRSVRGLYPEYRIKRTIEGAIIQVEPEKDVPRSEYDNLSKQLQIFLKNKTLVTFPIELLEPGTLPRVEVKTKRVVDEGS